MNIDAKKNNGWGFDQNYKYVGGVGNGDEQVVILDQTPTSAPVQNDVTGKTKKAVNSTYIAIGVGALLLIVSAYIIKKSKI